MKMVENTDTSFDELERCLMTNSGSMVDLLAGPEVPDEQCSILVISGDKDGGQRTVRFKKLLPSDDKK